MHYKPTQLVQRVWSRPPRCVAGFTVEPVRAPPPFEMVFDELAFFQMACPCGSAAMHILGYPLPETANSLRCPLSARCTACGHIISMFDVKEHGYDAEL
jgi:hypothetical protein